MGEVVPAATEGAKTAVGWAVGLNSRVHHDPPHHGRRAALGAAERRPGAPGGAGDVFASEVFPVSCKLRNRGGAPAEC